MQAVKGERKLLGKLRIGPDWNQHSGTTGHFGDDVLCHKTRDEVQKRNAREALEAYLIRSHFIDSCWDHVCDWISNRHSCVIELSLALRWFDSFRDRWAVLALWPQSREPSLDVKRKGHCPRA